MLGGSWDLDERGISGHRKDVTKYNNNVYLFQSDLAVTETAPFTKGEIHGRGLPTAYLFQNFIIL